MGNINTLKYAAGLPRPHKLYVQRSTPVGKDANGFELPPVTEWVFWCPCRGRGRNTERKTSNGEMYLSSAVVYADLEAERIVPGTRVEVRYANGIVKYAGEVKEFDIDDWHIRIWV